MPQRGSSSLTCESAKLCCRWVAVAVVKLLACCTETSLEEERTPCSQQAAIRRRSDQTEPPTISAAGVVWLPCSVFQAGAGLCPPSPLPPRLLHPISGQPCRGCSLALYFGSRDRHICWLVMAPGCCPWQQSLRQTWRGCWTSTQAGRQQCKPCGGHPRRGLTRAGAACRAHQCHVTQQEPPQVRLQAHS